MEADARDDQALGDGHSAPHSRAHSPPRPGGESSDVPHTAVPDQGRALRSVLTHRGADGLRRLQSVTFLAPDGTDDDRGAPPLTRSATMQPPPVRGSSMAQVHSPRQGRSASLPASVPGGGGSEGKWTAEPPLPSMEARLLMRVRSFARQSLIATRARVAVMEDAAERAETAPASHASRRWRGASRAVMTVRSVMTHFQQSLVPAMERQAFMDILSVEPEDRNASDARLVVELLRKTKFAKDLDEQVLLALSMLVRLQQHEAGEKVVRAGDVGDTFFIIISGKCTVTKPDRQGNEQVVRTLKIGDAFGELALQIRGGVRAATVQASTDAEFLALQGEDYRAVLRMVHQEEAKTRVEMLRRLPLFSSAGGKMLRVIAGLLERRVYAPGAFIFRQGEAASAMFFLTKGSVRLVRRLPLPPALAHLWQLDPFLAHRLQPMRKPVDRNQPVPRHVLGNGRPRSVACNRLEWSRRDAHAALDSSQGVDSTRGRSPGGEQRPATSQRPMTSDGPRTGAQAAWPRPGSAPAGAPPQGGVGAAGGAESSVVEGVAGPTGPTRRGWASRWLIVTPEQLDRAGLLREDEVQELESGASPATARAEAPRRAAEGGLAAELDAGRDALQAPSRSAQTQRRYMAGSAQETPGVSAPHPEQAAGLTPDSANMAWVELAEIHGPNYFGESAMLRRGLRHAAAIATNAVEVLVLNKVDFDLEFDAETRAQLHLLVSCYPKDEALLRDLATKMKWESFKTRLCCDALASAGKLHHLMQYNATFGIKHAWR